MVRLNFIRVCCINAFARVVTTREPPASAIYSSGYGYNYTKTDN